LACWRPNPCAGQCRNRSRSSPRRETRLPCSTHGLGLREAVRLGRQLHCMPEEMVIIGVEAGALGFSSELTPEVRDAMPELRRLVLAEL
jgi:hydrogenase maturation protease